MPETMYAVERYFVFSTKLFEPMDRIQKVIICFQLLS